MLNFNQFSFKLRLFLFEPSKALALEFPLFRGVRTTKVASDPAANIEGNNRRDLEQLELIHADSVSNHWQFQTILS